MADQQALKQKMSRYFFASLGIAFAMPFLIIPLASAGDGSAGLNLAILVTFVGFGGIFFTAFAGNQTSKRLADIPVRERFWRDEYSDAFSQDAFLALPLCGYFAKDIDIVDIDGNAQATIPRHHHHPVNIAIGGQGYKLTKTRGHLRHHVAIDHLPLGGDPIVQATVPHQFGREYEIEVGDKMRLKVVPEADKRFPTRSFLYLDDEPIGMVHIHEGITFQGMIVLLPTEWPSDLRLMLASLFWSNYGR